MVPRFLFDGNERKAGDPLLIDENEDKWVTEEESLKCTKKYSVVSRVCHTTVQHARAA